MEGSPQWAALTLMVTGLWIKTLTGPDDRDGHALLFSGSRSFCGEGPIKHGGFRGGDTAHIKIDIRLGLWDGSGQLFCRLNCPGSVLASVPAGWC